MLVLLHHSVWRQQSRLYEWTSLRQRLGDGTDPTVMSLQRPGEERQLHKTSPSFISLHSPCGSFSLLLSLGAHPQFSVPWWVRITDRWLTYPLTPPFCLLMYIITPHPPWCSHAVLPSGPALPIPVCFISVDFAPGHKNPIITPTRWRAGRDDYYFGTCLWMCGSVV